MTITIINIINISNIWINLLSCKFVKLIEGAVIDSMGDNDDDDSGASIG